MDDVKNKMYNYEVTPPEGVWEGIAAELDDYNAKVIPLIRKRNYTFYYAAAAVAVLVFAVIFFSTRSTGPGPQFVTTGKKVDTATQNNFIMTVPVDDKDDDNGNDRQVVQHKTQKGTPGEKKNDAQTKEDSNIIAIHTTRYITIEGPQGQPVKISSKMASLIDSTETKGSSKPIWNKKINEWREIMKGNTLAPTPGNFLDIVELTKTLKDQ